MYVFVSWSGTSSHAVADALADWLPYISTEINVFVSSEIDPGQRWQSEVSTQLDNSNFGILCVTQENQERPWVNFEAGALAKSVENAYVIPLLVDIQPADLKLPLAQFQAVLLDRAGVSRIATLMNSKFERPLEEYRLLAIVDKFWPELEEKINRRIEAPTSIATPAESIREDRDLLEEILQSVRGIVRREQDLVARVDAIDEAVSRSLGDNRTGLDAVISEIFSQLTNAGIPLSSARVITRANGVIHLDLQGYELERVEEARLRELANLNGYRIDLAKRGSIN